jgi:DNA-binding HxlR family transcriptional regulator
MPARLEADDIVVRTVSQQPPVRVITRSARKGARLAALNAIDIRQSVGAAPRLRATRPYLWLKAGER